MTPALRIPFSSLLCLSLTLLFVFAIGCQRSPEDLEKWRDSRSGLDQIAEWAQSERESDAVRIRAVQILIEEGQSQRVPRVLDRVEDEELRATMARSAMTTVEEMWAAQDIPELTDELRESGGEIAVGQSKAIEAKDAAYRLHPYLDEPNQQVAQDILRQWMSNDQELRTQLGGVTIPVLVSVAGDDSVELLQEWITETHDPRVLTTELRQYVSSEKGHRLIDEAVVKLAKKEHPELRRETQHAVAGAQSPAIMPYLEMAILEESTPADFVQASLDTIGEAVGAEAADFLARIIAENAGVLRWAAANTLIDAKGIEGLVDVARALPSETTAYHFDRDDRFRQYVVQLCSYYRTTVEQKEAENYAQPIEEVLAMDHWPAQAIGLECAARNQVVSARERVQELTSSRFQLPAWGEERTTLGQLAGQTQHSLSAVAEE